MARTLAQKAVFIVKLTLFWGLVIVTAFTPFILGVATKLKDGPLFLLTLGVWFVIALVVEFLTPKYVHSR